MRRTFDMRTGTPRELVAWWAQECGHRMVVTQTGGEVESLWSSTPDAVTVTVATRSGCEPQVLRGGEPVMFTVSDTHDASAAHVLRYYETGWQVARVAGCRCGWQGAEWDDTAAGKRAATMDAAEHIAQQAD